MLLTENKIFEQIFFGKIFKNFWIKNFENYLSTSSNYSILPLSGTEGTKKFSPT